MAKVGENRLQPKRSEAKNIPADGPVSGSRKSPDPLTAKACAALLQIAAANEHHRYRKVYREPAPFAEPYRNPGAYHSNASYGYGWRGPYAESNWSRYNNAVESPPAGH